MRNKFLLPLVILISVGIISVTYVVPYLSRENGIRHSIEKVNGHDFVSIQNPYDYIEGESVTVLFIGNSHTFMNFVPDTVARIAQKCLGKRIWFKTSLSGGKNLEWHLKQGTALKELNSRQWDFVSIQPQGVEPLFEYNTFKRILNIFEEKISQIGAKPVLYMTWARDPNNDIYDTYKYLNIERSFSVMQERLSNSFYKAKQSSIVAPAGDMWNIVLKRIPNLPVFLSDGYHASPIGSYITAITFISTIFPGNTKKLSQCEFTPEGVSNLNSTRVRKILFG